MHRFSFSHLDKASLRRQLAAATDNEHAATATLIGLIAEYDAQRFYLEDGYESMYAFCVQELHLSEQGALKRIRLARAARKCPAVLPALAENRVHLGGMTLLAPHLTPDNADDLLAAATHKTCAEIQQLLAERFPRPDLPARVQEVAGPPALPLSPVGGEQRVPAMESQLSTWRVEPDPARPKVTPLSSQRYGVQFSVGQRAYDKLCYLQALLGHRASVEELEAVFESGLDAQIEQRERQKLGKGKRPRSKQGSSADPRHVPTAVRCAVWERDGGQCAFVGEAGHRCTSRTDLEFDHIIPIARGGASTEDNVRVLCAAHNQYEAERIFGPGFMEMKREAARAAADERRTAAEERRAQAEAERSEKRARAEAERAAKQAQAEHEKDPDRSVVPWLRPLGVTLDNARRADAYCQGLPNLAELTLEAKIKAALRFLGPPQGRAA